MNNDITVSIYNGKSKKTGKNFQAIKLEIGDWSTLVFPRSAFELQYIKNILGSSNE